MAATIAAETALAPFRVGMKEVYLYVPNTPQQSNKTKAHGSNILTPTLRRPNFHVVLNRTPSQPANFASFTVPLWFSKLDLRDYLFHAYNVRTHGIRSYVKLQRVAQSKELKVNGEQYSRPIYKRWHRPPSIKRMTVELEEPFVWPEELEDYSAFNQDQQKSYAEEQDKNEEMMSGTGDTMINKERRIAMREQAKALLEGRAKWKPVEQAFTRR